jgi:hypothetical protein
VSLVSALLVQTRSDTIRQLQNSRSSMAAQGGKAALSSRLQSMGFMKRAQGEAAAVAHSQPAAADASSAGRTHSHAAASTSGRDGQQHDRQQQQQQQQGLAGQAADSSKQQQNKKYELSDKLTSMKFMQRGRSAKRGFDEAIGQPDAAKQEAEWVAPAAAAAEDGNITSSSSKGCVVIQERDPLPAGVFGRMSFGHFNPDTESLQQQAEARATGKPLPAAAAAAAAAAGDAEEGRQQGVSVTDDDMAGWGKGRNVLTSLRMQRNQKRQRVH